jgi:xylulokinase
MDALILAIDLGTSGPKVALVTPQGEVLDCRTEPLSITILPQGGAEQNPDDWWLAIKTATAALLADNPQAAAKIAVIGCTSQWSGTVAVDREGRHLMNAIIWMDARGAPYVHQITGGFPTIEGYGLGRLITWVRRSGGIPVRSGKDPIAHILFIKHEQPAPDWPIRRVSRIYHPPLADGQPPDRRHTLRRSAAQAVNDRERKIARPSARCRYSRPH